MGLLRVHLYQNTKALRRERALTYYRKQQQHIEVPRGRVPIGGKALRSPTRQIYIRPLDDVPGGARFATSRQLPVGPPARHSTSQRRAGALDIVCRTRSCRSQCLRELPLPSYPKKRNKIRAV